MASIRTIYTIIFIVLILAVLIPIIFGFAGKVRSLPSAPCEFNPTVCKIGDALGIPGFFLSSKHFIWYFIAPIVVIITIFYGFLQMLRIFRPRVNIILSVATALILIPAQIYTMLVATMMTILGTYSVAAFGIIFVIGVALISIGTITRLHGERWASLETLKHKMNVIDDSIRRLEENTKLRTENPVEWERQMSVLQEEKTGLMSKIDTIKTLKKESKES